MALAFGKTIRIGDPVQASSPSISSYANNVFLLWLGETAGSNGVYLKASSDEGSTFGPTINLANKTGSFRSPSLVVSENNVYTSWIDSMPGNKSLLFRSSNDGGSTFGPTINIANKSKFLTSAFMDASGNDVYVMWQEGVLEDSKLLLRVSNDSGMTFGESINLSNTTGFNIPSIKASGNYVYIVWKEFDLDNNGTISFRSSNDSGKTFEERFLITNNTIALADPLLSAFEDKVYVTWMDVSPDNHGIFIRSSQDAGANFEQPVSLDNGNGAAANILVLPLSYAITSNAEKVYLVGTELVSSPDIPNKGIIVQKEVQLHKNNRLV